MPKVRLTHSKVQSLTTTKPQEDYWDSDTRIRRVQFGVRVYATGKKAFVMRYRAKDGRKPQIILGDATTLGLAAAREKFNEHLAAINTDGHPAFEREQYRRSLTVAQLCEDFITHKQSLVVSDRMRHRTVTEYARALRVDVIPIIGTTRLPDVTKRQILSILDEIGGKRNAPAQARRIQAILHGVFQFALERDLIAHSPCVGLPKLSQLRPRERCLSDDEIRALWLETENAQSMTALILRLSLLTGQRSGEVAGMRRSEIKDNIWTIPGTRTKNKRTHFVPLSNLVLELLEKHRTLLKETWQIALMRGYRHDSDIVFPSREGKNVRCLGKSCGRIRRRANLAQFTPHDMRRTCATGLSQLGFPDELIAKILNHAPTGVTSRHYVHYDGLQEKKVALDKWAETIRRITGGPGLSSEASGDSRCSVSA
jgi:integrase